MKRVHVCASVACFLGAVCFVDVAQGEGFPAVAEDGVLTLTVPGEYADAVPGGVVETDDAGEPTGVLREMSAWTFRDRWSTPTPGEYLEAMRDGVRLANARGVTAIHDKDGWLGALDLFRFSDAPVFTALRLFQTSAVGS